MPSEKKEKTINLIQIMNENNINKEEIIKYCKINEQEYEDWMQGKEPKLQVLIRLHNLIKTHNKPTTKHKNIFTGTDTLIKIKYDKIIPTDKVKYYNETEIINNECPECKFPLQEDKYNMANIFGYDINKLKEIKYCDSCQKLIIIYK